MQLNKEQQSANKAALIYSGQVMHARLQPFLHRFQYKVFSLLIDLDRLEEADKLSRFFSVNRWNVLSFFEDDHGSANNVQRPNGETLREHVNKLLHGAGVETEGMKITLLCYPRIFGYVFNPISVYFVSDDTGTPVALIYEVRNTFGDMHTYVAPILDGQQTSAGIRQEQDKLLHVSPFMPMKQRYKFRIAPPEKSVKLRILEFQDDKPILSATFSGKAQPMVAGSIFKALLSMGFFSFKIMAGIHWEALKLWLKGARYHSRPTPGPAVSYNNGADQQANRSSLEAAE